MNSLIFSKNIGEFGLILKNKFTNITLLYYNFAFSLCL